MTERFDLASGKFVGLGAEIVCPPSKENERSKVRVEGRMIPIRAEIEARIEFLIGVLDKMDGDPDFEPDPLEEQHDAEAELTWNSGIASDWFVIAEKARRKLVPPDR